jgi:uncharacterized protein (TIGR03083 family)
LIAVRACVAEQFSSAGNSSGRPASRWKCVSVCRSYLVETQSGSAFSRVSRTYGSLRDLAWSYPRRMDRDQIYSAIAQERRRIADLIDTLDEAQLATESLCVGWDVKTVGSHLVSALADGTVRTMLLGWRRGSFDRALDEMARRWAQLSAAEIAATLRALADRQYWRPPPHAPGLLAEVLSHSGDIRIPLRLPFEPDRQLTSIALEFLTGPLPLGLVPRGRLRGIRWQPTDIDRTWGEGPEICGRAADLMMAAVGRGATLDALDGPGLALLCRRVSG